MSGSRRARWTTLDWAASVTFSAFWHVLVLAVLTLAVHPFQLPDQDRPISFEFLPPVTPPPTPTVEVQLRPRPVDQPPPQPQARVAIRPQLQPLPKPVEVKPPAPTPQRQLLDVARPSQPELAKPVEVERRSVQAPRLQTQQAAPQIPEAPPEPVAVTRPAPVLQPQVEVPRAQAPGRPQALDATRAPPQLPEAAASETPSPAAPSQVQVLTNQSVVRAPVEIRPRERAPSSSMVTAQPGAADIPAPGGGAPSGGPPAGAPGQAGTGQGGRPTVGDFSGVTGLNSGAGLKGGLSQTIGCENPDRFKLTPEERAACLDKFAQRAKGAPDLGLPISARKQAGYDRYEACQEAYKRKQGSIPNSDVSYGGSSIPGVAPVPKVCDSQRLGDR